jgi:hypothetical protein
MKRRDFVLRVVGSAAALPTVLQIAACGGSDSGGADAKATDSFTVVNTQTASPHPHSFTVNCADLSSSTDVSYTASGSGHLHTVPITAAELAMVAAGQTVTINTNDGHPHVWEVQKPANAC